MGQSTLARRASRPFRPHRGAAGRRRARRGRPADPGRPHRRAAAGPAVGGLCQAARKGGHQITPETLYAAGWVILVTSLSADCFSSQDVGALYRLRWRVELAFKRLKSLVGLKEPPAKDPRLAKAHVLAHLLIALLIEPRVEVLEVSPPRAPTSRGRWCGAPPG